MAFENTIGIFKKFFPRFFFKRRLKTGNGRKIQKKKKIRLDFIKMRQIQIRLHTR